MGGQGLNSVYVLLLISSETCLLLTRVLSHWTDAAALPLIGGNSGKPRWVNICSLGQSDQYGRLFFTQVIRGPAQSVTNP